MMSVKVKCLTDLSKSDFKNFLDSIDTVMTDCDEVLWYRDDPIPGSIAVINRFKELGKKLFFVTNNSTKSREMLFKKFRRLGFKADYDEIFCTAYLAATYIKTLNLLPDERVYMIGSRGLCDEFDKQDIQYFGHGPDRMESGMTSLVHALREDQDRKVGAVVVGFDEHFAFAKITKAASYLSDPRVHFIATNSDERTMFGSNVVIPGTGALVKSIMTTANRIPTFVGKPERFVYTVISRRFSIDPERTIMIGDTCSTDILLGTNCGFQTLLVLTGCTTLEEANRFKADKTKSAYAPNYYAGKLGDLLTLLT